MRGAVGSRQLAVDEQRALDHLPPDPSESGEISLVAQTTLAAARVFPNVARPARLIDFAVVSAVRAPRRYIHNNPDPTIHQGGSRLAGCLVFA